MLKIARPFVPIVPCHIQHPFSSSVILSSNLATGSWVLGISRDILAFLPIKILLKCPN
jgi:hypothetical protein